MKLAFTSTFDSRDISQWSGTPFHMTKAFEQSGVEIDYIGELKRKKRFFFNTRNAWKKFVFGRRDSVRYSIYTAKQYSRQANNILKNRHFDAIVAPLIHPICYLDSKKPIALWTDALYASLAKAHPGASKHSKSTVKQAHIITNECLSRCSYAIFSSDWAARDAIEFYGINKNKIKVVPFGANIECNHTVDDIHQMLKLRSQHTIKFLFVGVEWLNKGGEIVFKVVNALHAMGQSIELNFVGCYPPEEVEIPPYIKCHGFISKNTPEGTEKIKNLLRESHFLFVPSRAEAYGIVFCEANAFGVPCLTTHVGGIPTIVKDNINGMTFGLDASIASYCNYIMELMQSYSRYEEMALNAFHEYKTRLNWKVATRHVRAILDGKAS